MVAANPEPLPAAGVLFLVSVIARKPLQAA
jgi:hypothetical protein